VTGGVHRLLVAQEKTIVGMQFDWLSHDQAPRLVERVRETISSSAEELEKQNNESWRIIYDTRENTNWSLGAGPHRGHWLHEHVFGAG